MPPLKDRECQPDVSATCKDCGHVSWDTAAPRKVRSLVFLRGAVVWTLFVSYACGSEGCAGVLNVDSIEVGLLRRTEKLAFGHDLLYAWADLMTAGTGAKWWRFWRNTLSAYKRQASRLCMFKDGQY